MPDIESQDRPRPGPAEGDEVVVDVEDLAFGGRGVARTAEGMVIFVDGALPGESIRARVRRRRRGYAEAGLLELLRRSPDRTTPPCEHYGACGGCDLQHLSAEGQARAKREQVRAILSRLAGLSEPPVGETVRAGEPWGYRFRIDFDWTAGRHGEPLLGLHRRGDPGAIVPISRCHLISDAANRLAHVLSAEATTRHLVPWERHRRRGLLRRASFQEARGTGEILVTLETGRGDPPVLGDLARELPRRVPRIVGVVRREIEKGGEVVEDSILWGRDHLFEGVEEDRFRVPSGAFFQPNTYASVALRQEAIRALDPRAEDAVLELHCGVGFLTAALSRRAREVVAVEGAREAILAARENAARGGWRGVRFVHGEVAAVLPDLLRERAWDALLLDPPRTGLPRRAAQAIAASRVPRLVYVSCDPATLARDLRILVETGGFRLVSVTPVDLFPQTHHVECVALVARDPV